MISWAGYNIKIQYNRIVNQKYPESLFSFPKTLCIENRIFWRVQYLIYSMFFRRIVAYYVTCYISTTVYFLGSYQKRYHQTGSWEKCHLIPLEFGTEPIWKGLYHHSP